LVLMHRWWFPVGKLTVLIATGPVLMALVREPFIATPGWLLIAVALVGGIAAEGLAYWLLPQPTRRREVRLFAATMPGVLYTLYFLGCWATTGIGWSVH